MSTIKFLVDRDSVCAGDDCNSHAATLELASDASLSDLIDMARAACPLATIAGGQATWIAEVDAGQSTAVAVIAQQWATPLWLFSAREPATELVQLHERPPRVFFRYWAQADPLAVFEALQRGEVPPRR